MFKIKNNILKLLSNKKYYVYLLLSLCLAIFLLFRSPFSQRTLIPNFEPFPDAFYYVTPPLCFVNGQGWHMCRLYNKEIQGIPPAVTPLYSLSLLPSLALFSDPRAFYFSNLLLTLASFILLYRLSYIISKSPLLSSFIVFLYLTNSYIYWLPTIAMAENLLLTLFLLAANVLLEPYSLKKTIAVSIIAISFFATKKSAAPITAALLLSGILTIVLSKTTNKNKMIHLFYVTVPSIALLSLFADIEPLLSVLKPLSDEVLTLQTPQNSTTSVPGYFSVDYFFEHLLDYTKVIKGKSLRFLWRHESLVSPLTAVTAFSGLFTYLLQPQQKNKKHSLLIFFLLSSLLAQLGLMSAFYAVDARYIIIWLPIALLLTLFFLKHISKSTNWKVTYSIITLLFIFTLFQRGVTLKEQISLNLKYAETPWWYISIQELNTFIASHHTSQEKLPYVITLVSPYMTDYYSKNQYKTLPLDPEQDFRGHKEQVWGADHDYTNLHQLYTTLLKDNSVYVARYGIEGNDAFKESFAAIENNFNLVQVHTGCHNLCTIYKLSIKDDS